MFVIPRGKFSEVELKVTPEMIKISEGGSALVMTIGTATVDEKVIVTWFPQLFDDDDDEDTNCVAGVDAESGKVPLTGCGR